MGGAPQRRAGGGELHPRVDLLQQLGPKGAGERMKEGTKKKERENERRPPPRTSTLFMICGLKHALGRCASRESERATGKT